LAKYGISLGHICSDKIDSLPGIESSSSFLKRVDVVYKTILGEKKGKKIIIIAHGGTMWGFLMCFMNLIPDRKTFKNCAFLGLRTIGSSYKLTISINMEKDWYYSKNKNWHSMKL